MMRQRTRFDSWKSDAALTALVALGFGFAALASGVLAYVVTALGGMFGLLQRETELLALWALAMILIAPPVVGGFVRIAIAQKEGDAKEAASLASLTEEERQNSRKRKVAKTVGEVAAAAAQERLERL